MRRKQKKFSNPYKLESELCNVLIQHARDNGWKVYPETSGFDILLAKNGIQIGVQAKLKDNLEVLAQAIDWNNKYSDYRYATAEPDIRAVLVPTASRDFYKIASALGIYIIKGATLKWDHYRGTCEWVGEIDRQTSLDKYNRKYLTNPKKKCWTPDIEIDVPAGVKSPKQVTPWKVNSVRLCFLLRERGYLTSKDFKEVRVAISLWKDKWLVNSGEKDGKLTKYVIRKNVKLPDELYPEITNAYKKDRENK